MMLMTYTAFSSQILFDRFLVFCKKMFCEPPSLLDWQDIMTVHLPLQGKWQTANHDISYYVCRKHFTTLLFFFSVWSEFALIPCP